jgi:dTDP-4-dehydrorhamnose reductase
VRVLITGATGQLGHDLRRLRPEALALGRGQLSITDLEAVMEAVRGCDLVLNCAADNAVDAAEANPERARAVNAEGAANVALACRRQGARLVHFSTNFVFDGTLDRPYVESDPPHPLSAYGRSKLEGEQRVLGELPSALVIRSSGLFGAVGSAVKGGSFPERMVRRALAGQQLRVVADQHLNPTFTLDLAAAALELVGEGMEGLVHVVSRGCCSYWELACETLRLAGIKAPVGQVDSAAIAAPAPRPRNGCLRSTRVPPLREWQLGLEAWWREWSALSQS